MKDLLKIVKWWEILASFAATFSLVSLFSDPLGLQAGWQLWATLVGTSFCISLGYTGISLIYNNAKILDKQFCVINDLQKFKEQIKDVKELRIFASGSETYRTMLLSFLQDCKLTDKLKIKILVRNDNTPERMQKLVDAKKRWMYDIDNNYHTSTEIKCYKFTISLRGIIFDKKSAMLGWYLNNNSGTHGQSVSLMFFNEKNTNSKRIIDFAIETFDDTFKKADEIQ